jgi:hypothetical protein
VTNNLGCRFDDWIYWTSLLQLQLIIPFHTLDSSLITNLTVVSKSLSNSFDVQSTLVQFSFSLESYSSQISLYSRGTDHRETLYYYCRDVLPCSCLATSLGAYRYSNGLPIVVTRLRGKLFTGRCIETAVLLLLTECSLTR